MNNTTLGSVAVGFDHTLKFLVMLIASFRKYSSVNFAPNRLIFVSGDALKGGFIRPHDFLLSSTLQ